MSDTRMPAILDRQISDREDDAFGHHHFASALRSLIESPDHRPPFSIGLLGRWGTGKSSIKDLYVAGVGDDLARDPDGATRGDRIHVVSFNAWRFGGEDLKRALLRQVFLQLGGEQSELDDELYRQVERESAERKSFKDILSEYGVRLLELGIALIMPLAMVLAAPALVLVLLRDAVGPYWSSGLSAAVLGAGTWLFNQYVKLGLPQVSASRTVRRIELPSTSAEQYEELLVRQIIEFRNGEGKRCERLLVFVDDLDRLTAEEMVSGLEAIRAFMEIPGLQDGFGIVFVISCDEERIADAIRGRQSRQKTDLPGAILTKADARRFLDRIFQFRLEIPVLPQQDMRAFVRKQMLAANPLLADQLAARGCSVEQVVDRLIHPGVVSPRNAIQLANSFLQSWWLAHERESAGSGPDVRGGLAEGIVTSHPITLAALAVIKVDFPDFAADLQEHPNLLSRALAIGIHRSTDLADESATYRACLSTYLNDDGSFKADHSALRAALSYLADIRWPASIEPILRLSQDPATRRLGDGEPRLRTALLSGDIEGVLEQFGQRYVSGDQAQLTGDQCTKLHELHTNIVQHETGARRDQSSFVLASLSDRIPDSHTRTLLTPIARELVRSENLRWRVGVTEMCRLTEHLGLEDQSPLAEVLVSDFCRSTDEPVAFRLPTQEAPSLDQLKYFAEEAIATAISVFGKAGCRDATRLQLRSWLTTRDLTLNQQSTALPFSWLEDQLADKEDFVLDLLGLDYVSLVAAAVRDGDLSGDGATTALDRACELATSKVGKGEQSRAEAWDAIAEVAATPSPMAVAAASNAARATLAHAGDGVSSTFVEALASQAREEDDRTQLDVGEAAELLSELVHREGQGLSDSAAEAVAQLAAELGTNETTCKSGVDLAQAIAASSDSAVAEIANAWIEAVPNLPPAAARFLGSLCGDTLDDDQSAALIASLSPFTSGAEITKDQETSTRELFQGLPKAALSDGPFQPFANDLLDKIVQQHGNSAFLYRAFPVLCTLVDRGFGERVGERFSQLLSNTLSDPNVFGWLHHWMANRWRQPKQDADQYDADSVFQQADSFCAAHSATKWSHGVLQSMNKLHSSGISSNSDAAMVANAAALVWSTHPDEALEILRSCEASPQPSLIASLGDGIDLDEEENREALLIAWKLLAERFPDHHGAVVEEITRRPLFRNEAIADVELDIWLEAVGTNLLTAASSALGAEADDAGSARIVSALASHVEKLPAEDRLTLLEDRASLAGEECGKALTVLWPRFEQSFTSTDDRAQASNALLRALSAATSRTRKRTIAGWIKSLSGEATVRRALSNDDLTESDREILDEIFPAKKKWFGS